MRRLSKWRLPLFAGLSLLFVACRPEPRGNRSSAAEKAEMPARPDLTGWPEVLRQRIAAAEARLAGGARDLSALAELAQLYHANGFLREAEHAYGVLIELDGHNGRWPHLLATLLAGYGQLEPAIVHLQTAIARAPDYEPARLRLGDALLKSSRLDEAEKAYREVLAQSPENPYAWLGLARIDLATERLTAAREKLSRAIAADPKFFPGHSLLASVFERLGNDEAAGVARARANQARRFREAPDPWVEALMEFCYDAYRLQVAAASAKATGEPRAAVALLERAIGFAPDDARSRRQLGACWVELRDWPRAREQLEKAVELAPGMAAAYQDLAQVISALSSSTEALRVLATGLERCADKAGLHHQTAVMLLTQKRGAEALPHLQEAARLTPEKPEVGCDLARTLFELGREDDAALVLESALARHPEFPPALVLGVRHRIGRGDAEGAAQLLGRAERAGAAAAEMARLTADFRQRFGRAP